jgi:kynurenine 3-monooxygenase
MPTAEPPQFTIVGAGLAGVLLACYLGKVGRRVDLYEKRADPRGHEPDHGRSINLALSVRGLHALREVGLAEEVLRTAIPMRGRMMHARSGELTFQPYGKDETEVLHSVSRAGLNQKLIEAASRYDSVRCFFQQKCVGIDLHTGELELSHEETHELSTVATRSVVGADGAYSAVRGVMQKQERFDYQQEYLSHGYKELMLPAGPNGDFRMEPHALHIWPRGTFMMIALPNRDGSFTCTLFWPFEGPNSFAALRSEADVRRFFEQEFPDALPLMPELARDFLANPTGALVTVRCRPWHVQSRVVLIGDACHAVVPFLGQGMNAAFEDCTVLDACLTQHAPDWEAAFRSYESQRKENTDTLADLCVENFLEMRDRVGSRLFLLKKQGEILLHRLFPRWYMPLYNLITHTRTPYAEALCRARRQDRIVCAVIGGIVLVVVGLIVLLRR